jgi:predicted metal-dependent peptidase
MLTDSDLRKAEGRIQVAKDRLLGKYPFHAALLDRILTTADASRPTMAVTVRDEEIVLLYGPAFVLKISLAEIVGVLLHELGHVIFGHLTMSSKEFPDKLALTVAQEVTVNEFVKEPLPPTPVTLDQFPQLPPGESTRQRYKRLENKIAGVVIVTLDDHSLWAEIGDAQHIIPGAIEEAVLEAGPGTVPTELHEPIETATGKSPGDLREQIARGKGTLDWRQMLRRYVGSILEIRPTYNRPPRRFPELVGILPAQARRAGKPRVMAVIDTSGSISSEILSRIDGELRRLARHHSVLVVQCDAAVHSVEEYRGTLKAVHGRGGTDLRPPFARAFLRKHRPDLVIYFTDGDGPAPTVRPAMPVIWCLTLHGRDPAGWGRVVRMR